MGCGNGKSAWITGGSTGIGLAIARTLSDAGYALVLSARNEMPLREACTRIASEGGQASWVVADVTNRAAMNAARDTVLERHGRIDLLINNAGFNVRQRGWADLIPEEFDAVVAANLTGAFNAIHAVLEPMRAAGEGIIVSIASTAGKYVNPAGGVAYSVAKHGVFVMTRLLNQTELVNGIRACVIAPAGVDTRAHAWRPEEVRATMLRPEDVARAVRFAVDQPRGTAVWEIEITSSPE
jgi:NADP-dependent 3-hydroxy acid dehydrogenase YdfG